VFNDRPKGSLTARPRQCSIQYFSYNIRTVFSAWRGRKKLRNVKFFDCGFQACDTGLEFHRWLFAWRFFVRRAVERSQTLAVAFEQMLEQFNSNIVRIDLTKAGGGAGRATRG
jgi:hypothetical protein